MMGTTHVTSGVLAGALTLPVVPLPSETSQVGWVIVVAIASLAPDIDHPRSMLGRRLRPLSDVVAWLAGGHRQATHSALGVAAFAMLTAIAVASLGWPLWLIPAVALGCATHVLGDLLSVQGVPLFWPDKRRYALTPFKTGGLFESLVVLPVLLLTGAWVISGMGA